MFYGYDKTLNVYTLTDADVAADWRNGMLRSAAQTIVEGGKAEGEIVGSYGAHVGYKEGSLAEHFDSERVYDPNIISIARHYMTGHPCEIVSVTNLAEDSDERYEFSSFGDGRTYSDSVLSADVTCVHGNSGRMKYTADLGSLIYAIAREQV